MSRQACFVFFLGTFFYFFSFGPSSTLASAQAKEISPWDLPADGSQPQPDGAATEEHQENSWRESKADDGEELLREAERNRLKNRLKIAEDNLRICKILSIGGGLALGGGALLIAGSDDDLDNVIYGALLIMAGTYPFLAGSIGWVVRSHEVSDLQKQIRVAVLPTPHADGATLQLALRF